MTATSSAAVTRLRSVERLAETLHLARRSAELDGMPEFPRAEFRAMAEAGLLGLRIPVAMGGGGLGMADAGQVLHRLAYLGGTTFAKLSLQPEFCSVLADRGSKVLVDRYFRPLVAGECLLGNHITEPGAGSDVGGLRARAEPVGDGYILSGAKSEVAFAADADAAIVYARVGDEVNGGITAFLVPQDLPGVTKVIVPDLGERWMRRGTVRYDRVRIPAGNRIGEEGRAFEYLKEELVRERALLAMIYLGVARASWDEVVRHAAERSAFGRPLSDQQAVAFPIAEDGARLRAAELYVEEVLRRLETDPARAGGDAAMSKWLAVTTSLEAIDHALQFHGGRGYSKALPHEQRWRDVRSGAIAHGPSEIMLRIAARELWARPRPATSGTLAGKSSSPSPEADGSGRQKPPARRTRRSRALRS